ncbi:hypothetical protein HF1_05930 [Mycoplasma haemofelis str. Langford 1]|uniref:Uncharacterized protein n=1 Tax=Mycoplasma haemofelis (strain Langford 1) TaxID=941640 RepID=E8ZHI0_MYCHL|nr:hypothetical protein [Mycoplasma haemofelis]CBY92601.1 hypothetical protein HF1_05930 [Mycoplasma haemofelis str. Langford 1]
MPISKSVLGAATTAGVAGSGALAYKLGVFGERSIPTIKQQLKEKGYELIEAPDQWKTSFNAFKSDGSFITEINKYKEGSEALTSQSDENKGKEALKRMCESYLGSSENFDNASKWCVLRIQDKPPTGGWLPLVDTGSDASGNQDKWKKAFKERKASIAGKIAEITTSTSEDDGHAKLKKWCQDNLTLSFNTERKSIFDNASAWCVATT